MSLPDLIVRAALDATPLAPSALASWRAHLYPLDAEGEVKAWAGLVPGRQAHSTCGTHALACYREAGVDGRLARPWGPVSDVLAAYGPLTVRGGAIAALETLARDHGAYRAPSEAGHVCPGAVVVVGPSEYTSSPHAIVVTDVGQPTGGYLPLVTSEGGQPGARGPTDVRERARELRELSPGAWVLRDRGAASRGRQVLYWVDPAKLRSL